MKEGDLIHIPFLVVKVSTRDCGDNVKVQSIATNNVTDSPKAVFWMPDSEEIKETPDEIDGFVKVSKYKELEKKLADSREQNTKLKSQDINVLVEQKEELISTVADLNEKLKNTVPKEDYDKMKEDAADIQEKQHEEIDRLEAEIAKLQSSASPSESIPVTGSPIVSPEGGNS